MQKEAVVLAGDQQITSHPVGMASAYRGPAAYIALALVAPAFLLSVTAFRHLSLSPDSVNYFSAAASLRANGVLLTANGSPFVHWPPLLPVLMAGLSYLPLSLLQTALLINATCWSVASLIAGIWAAQATGSHRLGLAVGLSVACSSVLLSVDLMLLTEPLFAALSLLSLWLLSRYLQHFNVRWIFAASAACGAACLTRYAGLFLLSGEVLCVALLVPGQRRLRDTIIVIIVAFGPLLLWMLRNFEATGSFTGGKNDPGDQLMGPAALSMARFIATWYAPNRFSVAYPQFISLSLILLLGLSSVVALWACRRRMLVPLEISLVLLTVSAFAHLGGILLSVVGANACCTGGRFEAPFYPVITVAVTMAIFFLVQRFANRQSTFLNPALAALVIPCLAMLLSVSRDLKQASDFEKGAWGYGSTSWTMSPAIDYISSHLQGDTVFSNEPLGIYFRTGIRALQSPAKGAFTSAIKIDERPQFAQLIAHTPNAFLVWFSLPLTVSDQSYLFDIPELRKSVKLIPVAQLADADVYAVQPR